MVPQDSPLNEVEIFLIKEVRVLVPQDPPLYEVEMFFLLIRKTYWFEETFLIYSIGDVSPFYEVDMFLICGVCIGATGSSLI